MAIIDINNLIFSSLYKTCKFVLYKDYKLQTAENRFDAYY